ncbi:MAG TPA: hypothetical protein VFV02_02325 [Acidimicrobiales bacterium]|nr:hypothetical protein [Acidimicrobiales bacterium]
MDNRHRPDDEPGEAWGPDDESGEEAWDDGSREFWDQAAGDEAESGDQVDEYSDGEGPHTALPSKVEAWRRRSATGAILTGFAFGLQQVFEPKQDDPAVIMETSGEPPKDLPVEADLEYGRPRHSVVNIRPWLLPGEEQASDEPSSDEQPGDASTGAEEESTEEEPDV